MVYQVLFRKFRFSYLFSSQASISPTSDLVKPFLNKIHLMRSLPDLSYMTLDGPDLDPPRDHVFHLTFPADWKNLEIYQLFKQFGQIIIGWIDETHGTIITMGTFLFILLLGTFCYLSFWAWLP